MTDIKDHKWSDSDISLVQADSDGINLCVKSEHSPKALNMGYLKERDAIAIAKHFGLIGENLNMKELVVKGDDYD